jgi:predicted ATPase
VCSAYRAIFHELRREEHLAREHAGAAIALSIKHGFPHYVATGHLVQGWALTEQRQMKEGLAQMQQGLTISRTVGAALGLTTALGKLAEAYRKGKQVEEGLTVLAEAFIHAEKSGERFYEAELYRLKGELTLQQESKEPRARSKEQKSEKPNPKAQILDPQGEACFYKAIAVSRSQQAKSLELRATTSLARLWQQQGKQKEAHQMLSEIYTWFTEGFATKDLREAKALLDELSQGEIELSGH